MNVLVNSLHTPVSESKLFVVQKNVPVCFACVNTNEIIQDKI